MNRNLNCPDNIKISVEFEGANLTENSLNIRFYLSFNPIYAKKSSYRTCSNYVKSEINKTNYWDTFGPTSCLKISRISERKILREGFLCINPEHVVKDEENNSTHWIRSCGRLSFHSCERI